MSELAISKRVTAYHVAGKENDAFGHWVGADMFLDIPPAGRFLVTIATKSAYAGERIERALEDLEDVERIIEGFPGSELIQLPPFVLNDTVITEEVLDRKFIDRVVERDLAESLWYQGPLDNTHRTYQQSN